MKYVLPPLLFALFFANFTLAPFASAAGSDVPCSYTVTNAHTGATVPVPNRPVISVASTTASGSASGIFSAGTFTFDNEGACPTVEVVGFKAQSYVKGFGDTSWITNEATSLNFLRGVFFSDDERVVWNASRTPSTETRLVTWTYGSRGATPFMTLDGDAVTFDLMMDAASAPSGEEYQIALTEITYRVGGRLVSEAVYIPANPIALNP